MAKYMSGSKPTPVPFPPEGHNPRDIQNQEGYLAFGPYELAFGDTVNIWYAFCVGAISRDKCVEYGAKWLKKEISDAEKNTLLRTGKDSMLVRYERAKAIFDNNMTLPDPWNLPPPASMTVTSGGAKNDIKWEIPSSGTVDSYNVYRGVGKPDSFYFDYLGHAFNNEYTDTEVKIGNRYWYLVTAVDQKGIESGEYYLRNTNLGATPFAASASNLDKIEVVPNPFVFDDKNPAYAGEENKLFFAGLPEGNSTIEIYTQMGDLVETLEHKSGGGGMEPWYCVTKDNQYVASGIYIWRVKTENGDEKLGKFIIVR